MARFQQYIPVSLVLLCVSSIKMIKVTKKNLKLLFHFDNYALTLKVDENLFVRSFGFQNILYTCMDN